MLTNSQFTLKTFLSGQCSHFIRPENTRNPLVSRVFREYKIETLARNVLVLDFECGGVFLLS